MRSQVLQKVQQEVQALRGERPLRVRVRGLHLMKGDPAAAHVLYAGIQDGPPETDSEGDADPDPGAGVSVQKLQQMCAAVTSAFAEAGLVLRHGIRCDKSTHGDERCACAPPWPQMRYETEQSVPLTAAVRAGTSSHT